ncbi:class I SAM-dependent methyltransferase [Agaribacterium haliotis]|uniref:class I SAM-dependent methyltransferase n=1 Tax=Agaribacterium haliotis TaxID=2013869 RepID=UPI000BB55612|nr:class I SAM-dependent methyltransferase [Agaribacterium haliotis]
MFGKKKFAILSFVSVAVCLLAACSKSSQDSTDQAASSAAVVHASGAELKQQEQLKLKAETDSQRLARILEQNKASLGDRYGARHPQQTIEFFNIKPGMTVVEALPGAGWYSQILAPYLGSKGKLIGADYSADIWQHFSWASENFIEKRKSWPQTWSADVRSWSEGDAPQVVGTNLGAMGPYYDGQVDVVLFIRALHNMYRLQAQQPFYSDALALSFRVLKPGGVVGVVQHQAPDNYSLEWADGSRGYLNKAALIESFEKAGFALVAQSDVNENPKDQPSMDDFVWRLPPSLRGDEANKAAYQAIGESNRMTLLFKKPER